MPGGRPTDYNDEIVDKICKRISGGDSLVAICREAGFPSTNTVFQWIAKHAEFHDKYARAREAQTDAFAAEILDIADNGTNDYTEGEDGSERVNHDNINRSKLRVDTRKWLMSKLQPKKYGDRLDLNADVSVAGYVAVVPPAVADPAEWIKKNKT